MAWYYGTFSCGHEGRVNIIGPTKDRQRKADYKFSGMCEECYAEYLERKRIKENKEAAEKAKEMELPQLIGSEKQIAWANTLRQNFIEYFDDSVKDKMLMAALKNSYGFDDLTIEEVLEIRDYIIENRTDAKYFIDNRSSRIWEYIDRERKNASKDEKDIIEKQILEELEAEALLVPENAITSTVAEIKVRNEEIVIVFEKNDNFIKIVKGLGYNWDGGWRKKITETTGTATERIAEAGNKLLSEGFPIRIYDAIAREKAINADYEPEHTNWIYIMTSGDYKGWFSINWAGKNDKLYNSARKLPGSRWSNGSVVVKSDFYKEVEEYAELYNFKFTRAAKEVIIESKEAFKKSIVSPAEPKILEEKDGLQDILNSSREILDDLKDDE